ncbi:VWA domain-containing protein [Spirochaetota bacterium]
MFDFKSPEYFLFFLTYPFIIYYYIKYSSKRKSSIKFSSLHKLKRIKTSPMIRYRHLLFIFRMFAISLLISALARPQTGKKNAFIYSEGIEIMLCLDISDSMKGEDFQPHNRLEVAKEVIGTFVKKRMSDRIGLVVFGKESYLQCPLTLDHGVLIDFIEKISFHPEISAATAVGMAIANSVNSLKKTKAKSKIIVLLTDGVNNAGEIDPETAAQLADTFDIKIYSVGIGKPGRSQVMMRIEDPFFGERVVPMIVEMEEGTLKSISSITKGMYFNAQNKKALEDIYNEIDKLEKTKISTKQYLEYNERYAGFTMLGLLLLLMEILLAHTRFRRLP